MVRREGVIAEWAPIAPDSPVAIEAHGLSKSFLLPHAQQATIKQHFLHPFQRGTVERREALVDVSLEVRAGEFFGIVGLNGSGKSTLLKILASIYRQDAGTVRIHGKLSPFIELGVGFNPELSGRDNILVNGTLLGLSRRDLDERYDSILEFAELQQFADQKLKNYSSGMQLRLAYSIAIQVPFDILLLDEVLAVGDIEFQEKCFATFHQMRADGKTIVFVTHDMTSVSLFCDRALLLEKGNMLALGQADEVIAAYLGSIRGDRAPGAEPATSEQGMAVQGS